MVPLSLILMVNARVSIPPIPGILNSDKKSDNPFSERLWEG
jgi:hypothetical protein